MRLTYNTPDGPVFAKQPCTSNASSRRARAADLAAAALVLCVMLATITGLVWPNREKVTRGWNDFLSFYAGAQLAFTDDLYNPAKAQEVQIQSSGATGELLRYIRLPYYAAMLSPLSYLPYHHAYLLWQMLNVAALVGFVLLLPYGSVAERLYFTCWSVPLYWSFVNGQDLPFILLFIAACCRLRTQDKSFLAGLALSFCLAKFHLFLLLPITLIRQRQWRLIGGLSVGSACLIAISFLTNGLFWPQAYVRSVFQGSIDPPAYIRPNLFGLEFVMPGGSFIAFGLGLAIIATAWFISPRLEFAYAFVISIVGSLLITPHLFVQDTALLLCAGLIVRAKASSLLLRNSALVLTLPLIYLPALSLGSRWATLITAGSLLLIYSIAVKARRAAAVGSPAQTERSTKEHPLIPEYHG